MNLFVRYVHALRLRFVNMILVHFSVRKKYSYALVICLSIAFFWAISQRFVIGSPSDANHNSDSFSPRESKGCAEERRIDASRIGTFDYRLYHLFYNDEATAKSAAKRLAQGESIEEISNALSGVSSSNGIGGLTAWLPGDAFDPEILKVVRSLAVYQTYPYPIHSKAGWHFIRLDGCLKWS